MAIPDFSSAFRLLELGVLAIRDLRVTSNQTRLRAQLAEVTVFRNEPWKRGGSNKVSFALQSRPETKFGQPIVYERGVPKKIDDYREYRIVVQVPRCNL